MPGDVCAVRRSGTLTLDGRGVIGGGKAGRTISVLLPALNEEDNVESVIDSISPLGRGLVDELIVLD